MAFNPTLLTLFPFQFMSKLPRVPPLSNSHPVMFLSTSAHTQLLQPSLGTSIRGKRALTLSTLLLACCWVHSKAVASHRGEGTGQACYRESAALGQGYFRSMSTTSAIIGLFGFFFIMGSALVTFYPWTGCDSEVIKFIFLSVDDYMFEEVEFALLPTCFPIGVNKLTFI